MAQEYLVLISSLDAAGVEVVHRFATVSYYTNDTTPLWVDGRLRLSGAVDTYILAPGRLRGSTESGVVAITLRNADGGLDHLSAYSFEGQDLLIYALTPSGSTYTASLLFDVFTLEQPIFDEDAVTFSAREWTFALTKPLTMARYAGTNSGSPLSGIEGVADDLKGKPKPFLVGTVFNITPNLANSARLIYHVGGATTRLAAVGLASGWSMTVYDNRAVLTAGANYSSQADMEANAPTAGQYRVHPGTGCFRLGSTPAGRVTCDVSNPAYGTLSAAVGRIFSGNCPVDVLGVSSTLSSSPSVGIYVNEECTVLEALTRLLQSVNGYFRPGRLGGGKLPRISNLKLPTGAPA